MLDILTIGTATIDVFMQTPALKRVQSAAAAKKAGVRSGLADLIPIGSKVDVQNAHVTIGGGAFNTAVSFAKQGLKTGLVARIGNDTFGEYIHHTVEKLDIKPFLIRDNTRATGMSFILLDASGERTIFTHRGGSGAFSAEELDLRLRHARWAYISPGAMPYPVLRSLVRALREENMQIALNPSAHVLEHGAKKLQPILNQTDVVLLNREEASELTGVAYANKKAIFKKLDALVHGIALMTDAANGAAVSDGRVWIETKPFRVPKPADMTGAGDAFGSGFVSALIEKREQCVKGACDASILSYALRKGAANAASVVSSVGATEGALSKRDFDSSARWSKLPQRLFRLG